MYLRLSKGKKIFSFDSASLAVWAYPHLLQLRALLPCYYWCVFYRVTVLYHLKLCGNVGGKNFINTLDHSFSVKHKVTKS